MLISLGGLDPAESKYDIPYLGDDGSIEQNRETQWDPGSSCLSKLRTIPKDVFPLPLNLSK